MKWPKSMTCQYATICNGCYCGAFPFRHVRNLYQGSISPCSATWTLKTRSRTEEQLSNGFAVDVFYFSKKRLLNFSSAAALVHYRLIYHGWDTYRAQLFRWRLPFKIRPVIPSGGLKGAPRAACLGCQCCYCGMEKGYTNQGSIYLLTLLLARVYLLYWYTWWHIIIWHHMQNYPS